MADSVTAIQTALTADIAAATGLVVTLGLAVIGLAFTGFLLRKGKRAANGRV